MATKHASSFSQRLSFLAPDLAGVFVIVSALLVFESWCGDPGLGWHLRAGQLMTEHLSLLRQDVFLWPPAAAPWVQNQWLSEILLYQVWRSLGWAGLQLFALAALWGAHVLIPICIVRGLPASAAARTLAVLLAAMLGSLQWLVRPVAFSFLLFGLLLLRVRERLPSEKLCFSDFLSCVLFFALWANVHPSFFLGWLILGAALLEKFTERASSWRSWLGVLAVAVLSTGLNPYGFELHRESFALLGNSYFQALMSEWRPTDFGSELFLPFWAGVVVLLIGIVIFLRSSKEVSKNGLRAFDLIIALVLVIAAVLHRRFIPFFALGAVAPVAMTVTLLQRWLGGRESLGPARPIATLSFAALVLCAGATVALGRIPGRNRPAHPFAPFYPAEVSSTLGTLPPGQHLLIEPNWAGYITFLYGDRAQVFVDDRNELNGRERYQNFFEMKAASPKGVSLFDTLGFSGVLIERTSGLANELQRRPNWSVRGESEDSILLLRTGSGPNNGPR